MSNEKYWICHELKRRVDLAHENGLNDDEYAIVNLLYYWVRYNELIEFHNQEQKRGRKIV